ncbi:MAG: rRNA maturation RNase YbeY [Vampirovibrionia bacterium]
MKISISYSINDTEMTKLESITKDLETLLDDITSKIIKNDDFISIFDVSEFSDSKDEEFLVDLYLTNDKEIKVLNSEYRSKDEATDVLTFAMHESEDDFILPVMHLGEIIVSLDKVILQAKANDHSEVKELACLIIHGILHLFGMHHDNDDAYNKVVGIQNSLLETI